MQETETRLLSQAEADGFTAYQYLREMKEELERLDRKGSATNDSAAIRAFGSAMSDVAKSIYRLEDTYGEKGDVGMYGSPDKPNINNAEELEYNTGCTNREGYDSSQVYFSISYMVGVPFVIRLINDCTEIKRAASAAQVSGRTLVNSVAASHWARKAPKTLLDLPNFYVDGSIVSFSNVTLDGLLELEFMPNFERDESFYAVYSDPEGMYKTNRQQIQKSQAQFDAMRERVESRNSSSSSSGCYIATAVYGSYDCPEVWTLRRYRDMRLARSYMGRAFVSGYYKISPRLVQVFGEKDWFVKPWRSFLDWFVKRLNTKGFSNERYVD